MGYRRLAEMGIDMTQYEAHQLLRNGERRVREHDLHPRDMQPCTTAMHRGEPYADRPHAQFEVPGNGAGSIFMCRYCVLILAHTRRERDEGLMMELLETARIHIDPVEILIDAQGHMTSTRSLEELQWFARVLRLKPEWFQDGRHAHYDVMGSRLRELALKLGAHTANPRRVAAASRDLARASIREDTQ